MLLVAAFTLFAGETALHGSCFIHDNSNSFARSQTAVEQVSATPAFSCSLFDDFNEYMEPVEEEEEEEEEGPQKRLRAAAGGRLKGQFAFSGIYRFRIAAGSSRPRFFTLCKHLIFSVLLI